MHFDPLRLDQNVRSAARDWRRFRRALATSPETARPFELAARLEDPELLAALRTSGDPLSPALLGWLDKLHEQSRLAPLSIAVARAYRFEPKLLDAPTAGRFTLRELLERALSEPKARSLWLEAYLANAGSLADSTRRLWDERAAIDPARRVEVGAELVAFASAWLESTSNMFGELGLRDLSKLIDAALGSNLGEGWPSRLSARSLGELLREARWFDGLALDPEPLPRALSAASFLRGLSIVGKAWGEAASSGETLFALSRDPEARPESTYAELFAGLPLSPAFARRRLGLGAARLRDHLRGVAHVVLIETRGRALRTLLHGPALRGDRAFQEAFLEHSAGAFGFELPRASAGVLWRLHDDDATRFAAPFWAARRAERLVHEHDDDWFRNPRAVEELRAEARRPEIDGSLRALEAGRDALLSALLDALG